jgi:3-methyladenine DNA glycosylase Tag
MATKTESIPLVLSNPSLADVLDVMSRAVFQAGLSWAQIGRHWDAYRKAFSGFDPQTVAAFTEFDCDRALEEPGVLKSPRKVKATIANARALLAVTEEFGSFGAYVASFRSYDAVARDLKRRFSFMGAMNAWYLLFRLGEPVPRFEEWVKTIPGDHPRMREIVDFARASGRSPETSY